MGKLGAMQRVLADTKAAVRWVDPADYHDGEVFGGGGGGAVEGVVRAGDTGGERIGGV